MLAQDSLGTAQWLLTTAAGRFLGPLADDVVDVFMGEWLTWSPWMDPDWPPQA